MVKFRPHLFGHRLRHRSLADARRPEEQERARVGIDYKLGQHALGFGESYKFRNLARAILLAQANRESKSVFTQLDLRLRDALGRESLEDHGKVTVRLLEN